MKYKHFKKLSFLFISSSFLISIPLTGNMKTIDAETIYQNNPLRKQVFYAPERDEIYTKKIEKQKKEKQKKTKQCIFCMLAADDKDEKNLLLTRFEYFNLFINLYPYQKGHLLLIPKKHVSNLSDLSQEEQQELITIVSAIPDILNEVLGAGGSNVGINIGKIGGASKPDHIHIHVVPRYEIEYVSFINSISETQFIGYNLANLYKTLKPHFEELKNSLKN